MYRRRGDRIDGCTAEPRLLRRPVPAETVRGPPPIRPLARVMRLSSHAWLHQPGGTHSCAASQRGDCHVGRRSAVVCPEICSGMRRVALASAGGGRQESALSSAAPAAAPCWPVAVSARPSTAPVCSRRFGVYRQVRSPTARPRESRPARWEGCPRSGAPRPDRRRARSGGAGAGGGGSRAPTRPSDSPFFRCIFFFGAPRPRRAAACSVGVLRGPPPLGGDRHVARRRRRHAARRRVGRPFGVGGGGALVVPRCGVGARRFGGAAGATLRACRLQRASSTSPVCACGLAAVAWWSRR